MLSRSGSPFLPHFVCSHASRSQEQPISSSCPRFHGGLLRMVVCILFLTSGRQHVRCLCFPNPLPLPSQGDVVDAQALQSSWYLGDAMNEDSITLLRAAHEGSFVIRKSNSIQGKFVLSYRCVVFAPKVAVISALFFIYVSSLDSSSHATVLTCSLAWRRLRPLSLPTFLSSFFADFKERHTTLSSTATSGA